MELKIKGGPERAALDGRNADKVIPINFSSDDPFWDIAAKCIELECECRDGTISDLLILKRKSDGSGYEFAWRGTSRLSTIIGIMEAVKFDLLKDR
jgi:hypothetical protein